MICTNCNQLYPEDSRFCEKCGAALHPYRPNAVTGTPQAQKKPMGWMIVVVVIVLVCLCAAFIGGGFLLLRNQNSPLLPKVFDEQPATAAAPVMTPIPDAETTDLPQGEVLQTPADVPSEEAPIQPTIWEGTLLVVSGSGVFAVNEQTYEVAQLSDAPVNAPTWNLDRGISPDKKYFSYITGYEGASTNPMLVVLDIKNRKTILQEELTGAVIQSGAEGTHGDPAFEAFSAMQFEDSLAWSPDGTRLAFIAARDGDSADVYLFNPTDLSIARLSDENGHATALHWSPDGQFLQYVSVHTFGTGAGFNMESLWVYDFRRYQAQLLENLDSDGEEFLAWADNSKFWINSWSATCGGAYNLRIVDAISQEQQVIVDGGFTAAAYDPENNTGFFSVAFDYDNCGSSEPMDLGVRIFGEGIGMTEDGGIGVNKFEQITVYGIDFIPQHNLFRMVGDEGLQTIFAKEQYGYSSLEIPSAVMGFMPYPSPVGDAWGWASRHMSGLWVTENNTNPLELSPTFSGVPLWSSDGETIYFFENNQLFSASAPQYAVDRIGELPGEEILGVIKVSD